MTGVIRRPAVSGQWYPASGPALAAAADGYLDAADAGAPLLPTLHALVVPHAGLMYSGPVAAHAYRQLRGRAIDVAVLVGPSHFVGFDGVAVWRDGAFDTPLGQIPVDAACAADLLDASPVVQDKPDVHRREHSLEMQLPFLRRVLPSATIVPLLMGWQTTETARELARALAQVLAGRRAVLVASSDLSHYHDRTVAARLDALLVARIAALDAVGLQQMLDANAEHACGGGPLVAVLDAARRIGARDAVVLRYADSGDASGDLSSVVGYVAAAIGNRTPAGTAQQGATP